MARSERDYDAAFGPRGGRREEYGRYDTGYQGRGWGGWGGESGWGRGRYDAGFRGHGGSEEYRGGYRSRWQIEQGDPFGDRTARTPMRIMRGRFPGRQHEYDRAYDRGFARGPVRGYGRDYSSDRGRGRMNDRSQFDRYYDWF